MTKEILSDFVHYLPSMGPVLLAYFVAGICAVALRKRCPAAATCAAIGCAILFLNLFAGTFLGACAMSMRQSGAITAVQHGMFLAILGLLRGLVSAFGFVLVFVAVFIGRKKIPAPPAPPPIPPHA